MRPTADNAPDDNGAGVPTRKALMPKGPWRWGAGCLFVLLIPIVVLVLFDIVATRVGSNALDRQLQIFRSQGRRVSASAARSYPPAEDSLPLWKQIREKYQAPSAAADAMAARTRHDWSLLTAEEKQAMREHFAANTEAVSLMQEAASRPFFTLEGTSMVGLTKIIRTLTLYRGRLALEDGNTSEAIACVVLGAETAHSFARLPTYISAMLARLVLKSTVELGELALPGNTVPDALAERIMTASDPAIYRKALADSLENERVGWLDFTTASIAQSSLFSRSSGPIADDSPVSQDDKLASLRTAALNRLTRPVAALDGATIQSTLAEYADLALKEPWETVEARKKLTARIDAIPAWHIYAHAALPRVAPHSSAEDTLVRAQIMRIALACKRYSSAHGSLPESLEQLVPQYLKSVPTDPCTGKSMTYVRPAQGGFVLYSAGPDGVDDTKARLESGTLETSSTQSSSDRNDDFVWVEPAAQK